MGLLTTTLSKRKYTIQTDPIHSENITLPNIVPIEEGNFYLLIPLGALLAIIPVLLYIMAKNRRRLVHMFCKGRHERRFSCEDNEYDSPLETDPDAVYEEDDMYNGDNPTKSLLSGELQINNRYENYLSTSQLNRSSKLFT